MASNDDDIFGDDTPSSFSTDSESFGSSDSPKSFKSRVRSRINSSGSTGGEVHVPFTASFLNYVFGASAKLAVTSGSSAVLRAAYDIINEANEGEANKRAYHFQLESRLVSLHAQLRFANAAYQALEEVGRESNEDTMRFAMYLDAWIDLLKFSLDSTKASYTLYGKEHDLKIYPSVLDRGVYPFITPALQFVAGNPPGDQHYRYGDISELASRKSDVYQIWIKIGLEMLANLHDDSMRDVFS